MRAPADPLTTNIVLAGFMGTGKSTTGKILARLMGRPFVDTDAEIEAAAGLEVREIFSRFGEAAFRQIERDTCRKLSEAGGRVIALGGGALLDPRNREALEHSGVLVCLTCSPPTLARRLEETVRRGERPLLSGDIEERIQSLLAERAPVYSAISLRVDTTLLDPEQAARAALALFEAEVAARIEGAPVW